jgi:1-acyl-sn-glycerol-3-phosphate acyltransferase
MSPWLMDRWWDIGKTATFYAITSLFSYRMTGVHNVPRKGPVLVLANHQSFLDPILVGMPLPRYARFVARQSLTKNRLVARLIGSLRGVLIDQEGSSREGLQATLAALDAGHCVAMFPEGERTYDGKLGEFKPGFSLLVKKTKAPIVPVGIAGAFAAWPRTKKLPTPSPLFMRPTARTIAASVGEPIDPAKYAKMPREEMMADLRRAVQAEIDRAEALRRK